MVAEKYCPVRWAVVQTHIYDHRGPMEAVRTIGSPFESRSDVIKKFMKMYEGLTWRQMRRRFRVRAQRVKIQWRTL